MDINQINQIALGNALRAKRERDGFSQLIVADRLGYKNYNYLSMMESGRTNIPQKKITNIVLGYGFKKRAISVFTKKLQPESWKTFMVILEEEAGVEAAKRLDEKTETLFIEMLEEFKLTEFLKLNTTA